MSSAQCHQIFVNFFFGIGHCALAIGYLTLGI